MLGFIEARGGVEHELHIKYAEVMTVLFIMLTYGPGIPFMYVIGIVHYFIYYSVARWTLVRTVKRPQNIGDDLIIGYLYLLKFAPLLYLWMSYWMLSNKQIFDGWVFFRPTTLYPMETGHSFYTTLTLCQTSPTLIIFMGVFMIFILKEWFSNALIKFGFASKDVKVRVIENLPPLEEAMELRDRDWLIKEYNYYKQNYDMEFIPKHFVDALSTTTRHDHCDDKHAKNITSALEQKKGKPMSEEKKITLRSLIELPLPGCIPDGNVYNILNNHEYVLQFAYISPAMNKKIRDLMISDDDALEGN